MGEGGLGTAGPGEGRFMESFDLRISDVNWAHEPKSNVGCYLRKRAKLVPHRWCGSLCAWQSIQNMRAQGMALKDCGVLEVPDGVVLEPETFHQLARPEVGPRGE